MSGPAGPVRLVALDVDGTIVDQDDKLSERVRRAVTAVRESGRHVVIATGRSLLGTVPILDRLGLTEGYAVTSNGAVTLRLNPDLDRGYQPVDVVTFQPAQALALLREHLPQAVYAVEDLGFGFRLTAPFPDGELEGEQTIVPFDELLAEPVTRVVVRSPEHSPDDFLALMERIGLHGGSYAVGWTAWLDIAPDGVSKAHGLQVVSAALGVPAGQVLAVGDGRNDLEMFDWAGRAVAMGQAPEQVRAAADEVCPDVHRDGLAVVLEDLLTR